MFLCILILKKFALKVVFKAKRPGDIPSEYRPASLILTLILTLITIELAKTL